MALGPGKYDSLASEVRERTEAEGVVLVVLNGKEGNGFAIQCAARHYLILPNALEAVARQIRADLPAILEGARKEAGETQP